LPRVLKRSSNCFRSVKCGGCQKLWRLELNDGTLSRIHTETDSVEWPRVSCAFLKQSAMFTRFQMMRDPTFSLISAFTSLNNWRNVNKKMKNLSNDKANWNR
jgi:hypothetical protein